MTAFDKKENLSSLLKAAIEIANTDPPLVRPADLILGRAGEFGSQGVFRADNLFSVAFSDSTHLLGELVGENWKSPRQHDLVTYAQTELRGIDNQDLRQSMPLAFKARERLSRPNARVAVGASDQAIGIGDEVMVTGPLLRALLHNSPTLEIDIYTRRPYLYNHPRIKTYGADEAGLAAKQTYEAVIGVHKGIAGSTPIDTRFSGDEIKARVEVGNFATSVARLEINGKDIEPAFRGSRNVYNATYELMASLGLREPFLMMLPEEAGNPFFTSPVPAAEENFLKFLQEQNHENRPVALVNLWGGENATKGFKPEQVKIALSYLALKGYFCLLVSNGQPWGGETRSLTTANLVSPRLKEYIYVLPDPHRLPSLIEYAAKDADLIVTCEGGMLHFGSQTGKPMIFMSKGLIKYDIGYMSPVLGERQKAIPQDGTLREALEYLK